MFTMHHGKESPATKDLALAWASGWFLSSHLLGTCVVFGAPYLGMSAKSFGASAVASYT